LAQSSDQTLCRVGVIQLVRLRVSVRDDRPSFGEAAELVATVAEALHYAHRKGVVHRDVKPNNILLDAAGPPHVADFGMALKEENVGRGPRFAGTPGYMSPEQACREGHRVDGRADVFSLGVVFYELLTGRRPFRGETQEELLEQIRTMEARPPRQGNDTIPIELERICLKALAKRASERYTTAKDLADDLRHFLGQAPEGEKSSFKRLDQSATRGIVLGVTPFSPVPLEPVRYYPTGRVNRFLWRGCLATLVIGLVLFAAVMALAMIENRGWAGMVAYVGLMMIGLLSLAILAFRARADQMAIRQYALLKAAENGAGNQVSRLIEEGVDVNQRDLTGESALMRAAENGHAIVVKALLAAGAVVNDVDHVGQAALAKARAVGHAEVVSLLQRAGGWE
jgi:hypothetical protein